MTVRINQLSMLLAIICLVTVVIPAQPASRGGVLRIKDLRTEYKENPLGIDSLKPRFSWKLQSDARGVVQSAYQIRVAESEADLNAGKTIWDSKRVNSDQSIHRTYDGPPLKTGQRYYWQVRVWD